MSSHIRNERLVLELKGLGLMQLDLARIFKIKPGSVSHWHRHRVPEYVWVYLQARREILALREDRDYLERLHIRKIEDRNV